MNDRLQDIIDTFRSLDEEMRLELLLDYSKRLPGLPERLRAQRETGLNQVPECMTPVFLFVERDGPESDRVRLFTDVAEQAPTVRGILGIIVAAYDGAEADEIAALPADLVNRLRRPRPEGPLHGDRPGGGQANGVADFDGLPRGERAFQSPAGSVERNAEVVHSVLGSKPIRHIEAEVGDLRRVVLKDKDVGLLDPGILKQIDFAW